MGIRTKLTEEDINFIDELVRRAGKMALDMREGVGVHTKSGPTDLVTDADLKISRMVIAELSQRFPDDVIVSEEDKHAEDPAPGQSHPRAWLIDPIDGTENYVKQDGQHTCMIGLLIDGAPHYGWIYQPTVETLFSGGPDYHATKTVGKNKPEKYKLDRTIQDCHPIRLMMGWGDRRRHPWVMHLPNVKFVPSESLGLKIMKILEDEADVFISLTGRVKLWDTAAPAAIALGAGLDVGTAEGEALPYPLPRIQHGSSVIIGRPGAITWALKHVDGHATRSVPKSIR